MIDNRSAQLEKRLLVRMPVITHTKLALAASHQSRSMNDLVLTALADYLSRHPVPTEYADALGLADRIEQEES